MKILTASLMSSLLLSAGVFAFLTDQWTGSNVTMQVVLITFGMVCGYLVYSVWRQKLILILPALYLLFIILLPFADTSPVKPAIRLVKSIREGMSEAEVRSAINRHFPETGEFKRPDVRFLDENLLSFVLDPDDGRYNAAIVQIHFANQRVVSARFLAD